MKSIILTLAILLGSSVAGFSQSGAPLTTVSGFEAMANLERLPLLHPFGTQTKQFASFDVSGGNVDWDFGKAFTKYVDDNGESVIFDEIGPGCLFRQQMNVWVGWKEGMLLKEGWGQARIKYYFDDEAIPRIDMTIDELFRSQTAPFTDPLCFFDKAKINDKKLHRFAIMYYPFSFGKRLKVTIVPPADRKDCGVPWYQYTYLAYPKDPKTDTWKGVGEDGGKVRDQWQHLGRDPKDSKINTKISKTITVLKGETKTLLELRGRGSIASLKLHLAPFIKDTFFNTNIKIFWDDALLPAVDLPLGYFFGGGGKDLENGEKVWQQTLTTLLFGFDHQKGDFYAYWPMPYWSAVRIVVENRSAENIADFSCELETRSSETLDYPLDGSGYFCAKRTLDEDTNVKPFANAFKETGRGHVVGMSFYSQGYDGDGDEFTYMDGSRSPQIHGDGTEDDHNQGWGGDAYQKPLWGGLINGFQGAYRIYLNDRYIFHSEIAINYEYSQAARLPSGGKTDVTVFYYKAGTTNVMRQTDQMDVGKAESEMEHRYAIAGRQRYENIFSAYDGFEKNVGYYNLMDDGRAYDGYSQFVGAIDPNNLGVKLRKRLNRLGNGVQTARVFVDGAEVGIWHVVSSSYAPINQAWLDSDFDIPAAYTQGKNSITVRVGYVASRPMKEINEYYYWIFCYSACKETAKR